MNITIKPLYQYLLAVVIVAAGYFVVVQPLVTAAFSARDEAAQARILAGATTTQITAFRNSTTQVGATSDRARYDSALPTGAATNDLIASLEATLTGVGSLTGVSLQATREDEHTIIIPVTVQWQGSYTDLKDLITHIGQSRRILAVKAMRVSPTEEDQLSVSLDLEAYGIQARNASISLVDASGDDIGGRP